jgi:2-hydroxy-3-keto-5-methylthiopentenyl-1-phosphate phosphatase
MKDRNDEFIKFEVFEEVAEDVRKIVEAEKDNLNKLTASEELYIRRLQSILKEFDRVKDKGVKVTDINVDTTEYYTFQEFLKEKGRVIEC